MTAPNRLTISVLAGALAAAMLPAQEQQAPPAGAGRGRAGRGVDGAAGGGRRVPNFPQQTRPLAGPEVIARGKAVYGVNCAACHGGDLRGGDQGGPSLLRSLVALSDQHGELIAPIVRGARQDKGMPALNLTESDVTAVSEYIHSVLSMVGSQARPPGAADPGTLNVQVGSASAGQVYFQAKCTGCHSITGDLKAIASKYSDARTLQNTWVTGGGGGGRGGRGGGPTKPTPVTVTLSNGQKLEGMLIRKDDFIVTLMLADGNRRSITRNGEVPKVDVHDPDEAHKKLVTTLDDKDMHDVTAYLATVK
ncbi:MAG TPA: cytochrome c [Candidatus Acidoferrales bacterium]|jgi:cytochrome c oxidase cbb3-type subunit 3|nr:cytochrome c [Candidatus Acidoferrales bacterium]